jgi:hypothetical protein
LDILASKPLAKGSAANPVILLAVETPEMDMLKARCRQLLDDVHGEGHRLSPQIV